MVELPKVSRRLVTVEEPRSGLSGRDIAAPYAILAEAAGDISKAIEPTEAQIEAAATRAVTTDANGNVQVERSPIPMVGRSGQHFEKMVKTRATVEADSAADRDLIELRATSKGDPAAFQAAANTYRDERVAQLTAQAGPAAGAALKRQMDNRINSTYSGLLNEHQNIEIKRANAATDQRLITLADETEQLADKGGIMNPDGSPTPQYTALIGNIKALLQSKVDNPLLGFPQEKADAVLEALETRVQGAAIHEQMKRIYRGEAKIDENGNMISRSPEELAAMEEEAPGGVEAGRTGAAAAREYLTNASRNLEGRVKQIAKIEREGKAWLHSEEAGMRGYRDAISREWGGIKANAASLPDEQLHELQTRAQEVGNFRVAADIATQRAVLGLTATLRAQPESALSIIRSSGNPTIDGAIDRAAERHGVPRDRLRRIAKIESDFNPLVSTGSYHGLFQMSQAEFRKYGGGDIFNPEDNANAAAQKLRAEEQTFEAQYGRKPADWELYMIHQQGEGGFAAHSRNPDRPAWENMGSTAEGRQKGPGWAKQAIWGNIPNSQKAQFGSVENVTSRQFMELWAARVGGVSTDVPARTPEQVQAIGILKRELAKEITPQLTAARDRMRRGEIPSRDEVTQLATLVGSVGTPQQQRQAATLMAVAEYGEEFKTKTGPERDAIISAMETDLKDGGDQVESDLVAQLRTQDKAIGDLYKADPYGAHAKYGKGSLAEASPPVDFNKPPQEVAAAIAMRVNQQPVIREQEQLPPLSIFRPSEVPAFQGVMANANAQKTTQVLSALSQLPDDVLQATLQSTEVRTSIMAAASSTDKTKVDAVMGQLQAWQRRDPAAFKHNFKEDGWNALQTWQGLTQFMTQEQFAEHQKIMQDPRAQETHKRNITAGEEIARKYDPEEITTAMAQRYWGYTLLAIGRPEVPTHDHQRAVFQNDFTRIMGIRSAATPGKKDLMLKDTLDQLDKVWKPSPFNGGELMRNPPESLYPKINDTHDWMAPQAERLIAERLGVPFRSTTPALSQWTREPGMRGAAPGGVGNIFKNQNFEYRVVADEVTEQEAQRYNQSLPASDTNKPPSYQLMVKDLRTVDPKFVMQTGRMRFDPDQARAADQKKFTAVQDTPAVRAAREAAAQRKEGFERRMGTPSNVPTGSQRNTGGQQSFANLEDAGDIAAGEGGPKGVFGEAERAKAGRGEHLVEGIEPSENIEDRRGERPRSELRRLRDRLEEDKLRGPKK